LHGCDLPDAEGLQDRRDGVVLPVACRRPEGRLGGQEEAQVLRATADGLEVAVAALRGYTSPRMLDIKVLRENPDAARAGAIKKHMPDRAGAVDRALALDAELRAMTPRLDAMRSEQKSGGKKLGKLNPEEREAFLQTQKELKATLSVLEDEEKQRKHNLAEQLGLIPNIPDEEVPDGKDDSQNTEVRKVGVVREFDFPVRAHYDIGEAQGWLDFTRAAEMAGSRNYILFGDLVLLHDAVLRFAVDLLVERGF